INSNKGRQYSVAGYADKETGSESINEVLSQKRAEAVRDALVKAGVSPDQIKVDYYGCRVQPFEGKGYLNRVAIIK
ncbi:MAG: OmpA family protein, partial [Bacteroidales bacterium]|nr:OmpA family protein [Bacteroidales bacterium]